MFSSIGHEAVGVNVEKPQIFNPFCHYLVTVFSLTWPAAMIIQVYWNKRKCTHKKRVKLPQDWFGAPTSLLWGNTKTLYSRPIGSVDATPSITRHHFTRNFSINIIFTDEMIILKIAIISFSKLYSEILTQLHSIWKNLFQDTDKFSEMVNSVIVYLNSSNAALQ